MAEFNILKIDSFQESLFYLSETFEALFEIVDLKSLHYEIIFESICNHFQESIKNKIFAHQYFHINQKQNVQTKITNKNLLNELFI